VTPLATAEKNRPSVLFLCGSLNQTTQLEQVARELTAVLPIQPRFSPYYVDGYMDLARRLGFIENSVAGSKLRDRCLKYLTSRRLPTDDGGLLCTYDLVVACSDIFIPKNVAGRPLVVVQEGILDPLGIVFRLCVRFPKLPRWIAGTAATGTSQLYDRFCVASDGYRDLFIAHGADPAKVVTTGIPNFDRCSDFAANDFPFRNYVLACTSDARETFKISDRAKFLRRALSIAAGRQLIVKLHPNEREARAIAEIRRIAPDAIIYNSGRAEHMIANCDVLVTEFSSTAFVGLALGKEVCSKYPLADLRALSPLQNRMAAANIARVCADVLERPSGPARPARPQAARVRRRTTLARGARWGPFVGR
jgi:hypothetical protein